MVFEIQNKGASAGAIAMRRCPAVSSGKLFASVALDSARLAAYGATSAIKQIGRSHVPAAVAILLRVLKRNVVIFHQAALGDFIITWPLAMALSRVFPQSRIIYVTHSQKGALASACCAWNRRCGDGMAFALFRESAFARTRCENARRSAFGHQLWFG